MSDPSAPDPGAPDSGAPDRRPDGLDPDPETMRRIGYRAVDRIVAHLTAQRSTRVARRHDAATLQAALDEPLPRRGRGLDDCIDRFFSAFVPHATQVNHPRFFAYIPGPGSYAGALGSWIAAATNHFVGTWLGGASMVTLELQVLGWLREALGLPADFDGLITSGGSLANLGALAAARSRLAPGEAGVVYAGDESHHSVLEATRILGLPARLVRTLPCDPRTQRLDARTARSAIAVDRAAGRRPLLLCANAGSTTTGAIDPLAALAELCAGEEVWLHVDAAYGGAAALTTAGRDALAGWERADSITLDPHKWLYAPFEAGCLLTRHPQALRDAYTADAPYLRDVPKDAVNFCERGPELSRGNRALKLWFLMRGVGVDAIAGAVREDLRLCRLAAALIGADPRLEIVTPPRLSIFTFAPRRGGDGAVAELIEAVLEDGFAMLSSSTVAGRAVLRWCVANHRTTEADVRASVQRVRELLPS